jgi:Zn-dependent protease with chaperone function
MTIREIENHPIFRRAFWRRNLYLALLLILELALLGGLACLRIGTHKGQYHLFGFDFSFEPWKPGTLTRFLLSMAILAGFTQYAFRKAFKGKGMIHLYPTDRSKGRLFGTLRGPELVEMVQGLARELGAGRIDRIAVTKQPDPNAYTARVLGLGNVVVLHSNLLSILPREGVRSVIAHEIGHVRRKDSLLHQLFNAPRAAFVVIVLINFFRVVGGVLDSDSFAEFWGRLCFLGLACLLASWAFGLLGRLANLASQQTELLVDAYAAQACGWDKHLNALLLLGERAEALTAYVKAVRGVAGQLDDELNEKSLLRLMNRLSATEFDAQRAVTNAAGLYVLDRLSVLRDKLLLPLTDEEITTLAARAAEALRQRQADGKAVEAEDPDADTQVRNQERQAREEAQRKEEGERRKEEELRKKLLFWRDYDKDRSGFLDRDELTRLVEDLRKDPQRMIFREFLEPDGQWQDHPTTRHRILFLADIFAGRP